MKKMYRKARAWLATRAYKRRMRKEMRAYQPRKWRTRKFVHHLIRDFDLGDGPILPEK